MPLYTSDNPLSFYNAYGSEGNLGIISPGVEIRFPLSNELLLFSYDPATSAPAKGRSAMSSNMIKLSNEMQIRSSTRFIYSSINDFDYAAEYLKRYPKYSNPKRSRWKVYTDKGKIETIMLD